MGFPSASGRACPAPTLHLCRGEACLALAPYAVRSLEGTLHDRRYSARWRSFRCWPLSCRRNGPGNRSRCRRYARQPLIQNAAARVCAIQPFYGLNGPDANERRPESVQDLDRLAANGVFVINMSPDAASRSTWGRSTWPGEVRRAGSGQAWDEVVDSGRMRLSQRVCGRPGERALPRTDHAGGSTRTCTSPSCRDRPYHSVADHIGRGWRCLAQTAKCRCTDHPVVVQVEGFQRRPCRRWRLCKPWD